MSTSLEPFLKLYDLEKNARDMYEEYAGRAKNRELRSLFLKIKSDEERHMKIAEKIIEIVQ